MTFLSDLRRAFRNLLKARGFAAAVILTLALGIGANTAMFTLLRGTLLRPLPNRDGERLVYLRQSAKGAGQDNVAFSVPEIIDYRTAHPFKSIDEVKNVRGIGDNLYESLKGKITAGPMASAGVEKP